MGAHDAFPERTREPGALKKPVIGKRAAWRQAAMPRAVLAQGDQL